MLNKTPLCIHAQVIFLKRPEQPLTDTELATNKNKDITKVQLGEPMSLVGVTYRNISEELFIRAEMIQRQMYHQSPLKTWVTLQKLETCITLHSLQATWQAGVSFPSASFQAAGLI